MPTGFYSPVGHAIFLYTAICIPFFKETKITTLLLKIYFYSPILISTKSISSIIIVSLSSESFSKISLQKPFIRSICKYFVSPIYQTLQNPCHGIRISFFRFIKLLLSSSFNIYNDFLSF